MVLYYTLILKIFIKFIFFILENERLSVDEVIENYNQKLNETGELDTEVFQKYTLEILKQNSFIQEAAQSIYLMLCEMPIQNHLYDRRFMYITDSDDKSMRILKAISPIVQSRIVSFYLNHHDLNVTTQCAGIWNGYLYYRLPISSKLNLAKYIIIHSMRDIFKTPQKSITLNVHKLSTNNSSPSFALEMRDFLVQEFEYGLNLLFSFLFIYLLSNVFFIFK